MNDAELWNIWFSDPNLYYDDRIAFARAVATAAAAEEREHAALVCDDEARIRTEAAAKHPEFSEARGRCNAAARGAINCAKGVRSGEIVIVYDKLFAEPGELE